MGIGWGDKIGATQLTSITTEQFFNIEQQMAVNQIAHIEVTVDFPSTPTDNALIKVYHSLDDSTIVWDDQPFLEFTIDKDTDPNKVSFTTPPGIYRWRVGVQRDGTTDTFTDADLTFRIATLS